MNHNSLMKTQQRKTLAAVALLGAMAFSKITPAAAIPEETLHAIGVDAYTYFYPLLSMDITRKQFTNIEPGKPLHATLRTKVRNTDRQVEPSAGAKSAVGGKQLTAHHSQLVRFVNRPHPKLAFS